jgi:TRAP-type mannitol/chloroaromatic compound transport system permease large subunit
MRSVAPSAPYKDRVSGKMMDGVTTMQIYRGGGAFIIMQLIMVAVVIAYPWLSIGAGAKKVDIQNIEITLPSLD